MCKLSERDELMIIYTRKFLEDARDCIDYGEFDHKKDIEDCLAWMKELRTRL